MSNKFTEEQKFTQWWVWTLMFGLFGVPIFTLFDKGLSASITPFIAIGLVNVFFY